MEQLLHDCLRRANDATAEQLQTLTTPQWIALLDLANERVVLPLFGQRLLSGALSSALPEDVRRIIVDKQRRQAIKTLRVHQDFRTVVLALQQRAIPVIALKGIHLASLVYHDLAARASGDIDLLVPASELSAAGEALQELGYAPMSPYRLSADAIPHYAHHLPRALKTGATPVEIHWHLVRPDSKVAFAVEELWKRVVPARIAGVDVKVLAPEDLVLHLCVHATYHHLCEFGWRPWCDIRESIREYGGALSWHQLVERATRWRCRRGVYLALRVASEFGARVPETTLRALKPAGFEERLLAVASQHRHKLPATLAPLYNGTWTSAFHATWRRVFLPKDHLADLYNVPRSSRALVAFYAVRLNDLIKRHAVSVLQRRNPQLLTHARDALALQEFLAPD